MSVEIIISVILILILLVIIYFLIFVRKKNLYTNYPIHNYSDIRNNLKTGDVILFSCTAHQNIVCEMKYYIRTELLGSEFGHVGLILRHNNKLYCVECTTYHHPGYKYAYHLNDKKEGGIRIVNLDKLLSDYDASYDAIFAVKHIEKEIDSKLMLKKLREYKDIIFSSKMQMLVSATIDIAISHKLSTSVSKSMNMNRMICSQFAYHILREFDVLDDYPDYLFWPVLYVDGTFDKLSRVKYSDVTKFRY